MLQNRWTDAHRSPISVSRNRQEQVSGGRQSTGSEPFKVTVPVTHYG